jgi:outer membrane protein assembly factor BamB
MLVGIGKMHTVGTILSSPVISGNVVYVGSADGNLYALQ